MDCLTFSTDSTRVEGVFPAVWRERFGYPAPKHRNHHLRVDLQWCIVGAVFLFSLTVASLYSDNRYLPRASGRFLGIESFFWQGFALIYAFPP